MTESMLFRVSFRAAPTPRIGWVCGEIGPAQQTQLRVTAEAVAEDAAAVLCAASQGWALPVTIVVTQMSFPPGAATPGLVDAVQLAAAAFLGSPARRVRLLPAYASLPEGIVPLLAARRIQQAAELLRGWSASMPSRARRRLSLRILQGFALVGDTNGYAEAFAVLLPEAVALEVLSQMYLPLWEAAEGDGGLRAQLSAQASPEHALRALLRVSLELDRWDATCGQLAEIVLDSAEI